MIGLLPQIYSQALRKEKIIRMTAGVFILGCILLAFGIVFILPSYFFLVFSLDDVLRSLDTKEVVLKRRDVEGLESRISYANSLLDIYFKGESQRKNFSSILLSVTNPVSDGIKITNIEFQKTSGEELVFHIRGEAKKRSDLILFSQKLRQREEVKELRSPVSNLLEEENVKFLLELFIKPEFYEYKN